MLSEPFYPLGFTRRGDTVTVASLADTDAVLSAALRREGHIRRFRTGQALFTEGDQAERVFLIEGGWVIVTCGAPSGREIVLGLCGRGDVLGELSALDGKPRSATAVAVEEVEAIVAPGTVLTRALEEAHAAHELIRVLAARLRDADRKRLEFAALDTLGRVSWRLLELSDRFGHETDEGTVVELPVSQEQLASWCGASREATVKALGALRAIGCIRTGRRSLVISDIDALSRCARGIG
jgi:CRP/FNR family cyclic AMP-dependent transcriptional regulator